MAEIKPLAHVAVVGGGTVALLAAVALARALPGSRITLVPCAVPEDALADHAVSGGAALQRLHARLGIEDALLFARAGATPWLATRYRGFGPAGEFFVGHGVAARDPAGGFAPEPSLASLLAEQELCLPPGQEGAEHVDVLLRLDPEAYRGGLHALARQAGVQIIERAMRARGSVHAIEADLIVDASGSGWVRAEQGDATWLASDQTGQVRRLCRSFAPTATPASLCDTVTKSAAGYLIEQPGRHRVAWTTSWADMQHDARMRQALEAASGAPATPPVVFRPGRLSTPWLERVVAIGDAAARFAPLGSLNLHLAAAQILLLLELLPGGTSPFVECAEYNRRAGLLADHAQDFVLCQEGKHGTPFFAQRIDQFRRRGWIPELAEGCVSIDAWAQLMIGLGIEPGELPRLRAMNKKEVAGVIRARQARQSRLLTAARPYRV